MAELVTLFSQQWCDAARDIVNSDPQVYADLHDAPTFTNHMHFGLISRPEVAVHLDWEQGRVGQWTPAHYREDDLWAMLNAEVETWKQCAEGASGSKLLMAGKIKLAKGPMAAAIQNAKALDRFLNCWGQIPTDWNI